MYTILGAGLSGLSTADHLQQKGIAFQLFEAKTHGGGHIHSEERDGFIWDEGPHVSFTKHDYVRNYFAGNCNQDFREFAANPANYFKGSWIPHPAQSHMYAVPAELRTACIKDVLEIRNAYPKQFVADNYQDWIDYAFGKTFAENFPKAYTKKYWTTEPVHLATDWIGKRIYFPDVADMADSADGPLEKQTHYISSMRYPNHGGYYSYIKSVEEQLEISYNHRLSRISFKHKVLEFDNGHTAKFSKLINTLPLPLLIQKSDAPDAVKHAAAVLKCSQVLIINVIVSHPAPVDHHWIYVYDENFYSTRINFTESLSPNNGKEGCTGIQVEVYFSDFHPLDVPIETITAGVISELVQMGLIKDLESLTSQHTKWVEWANVIFDTQRLEAQEKVLQWLSENGLVREQDDLEPMTDWENKPDVALGDLILAGRFAQWKYFWTDDCVMRALYIANHITS